jgi:hypothetical protein
MGGGGGGGGGGQTTGQVVAPLPSTLMEQMRARGREGNAAVCRPEQSKVGEQ